MGCAYRTNWNEEPLAPAPRGDGKEEPIDPTPRGDGAKQLAAVKIWNSEEIQLWFRVTIRLAGRLSHKSERLDLVNQRWESAKPHIEAAQMEDVETLLHELEDTIAEWPEALNE